METFTKLHNDFCDNDDLTTRIATLDAVAEAEATDSEFVIDAFKCPICNERRADYLVVNFMAEEITCANCGARYDIDTDDMFTGEPEVDDDDQDTPADDFRFSLHI